MFSGWVELSAVDFGHFEHLSCGNKNRVAVVLVRQVNDFFYAYLDDQLIAFISAWQT